MSGKLVIVPTPLGNLGDMTPRALDALRAADVVCAEDTRVTGKLLAALGVPGKRLERLDENKIGEKASEIIARVQAGETIAYCSDAGMPGVSDPGLRLVAAAREANTACTAAAREANLACTADAADEVISHQEIGAHKAKSDLEKELACDTAARAGSGSFASAQPIEVEVLPGPTAVATAYVASGTICPRFYFGGFFPRKDAARRRELDALRSLDAALIFYESPNRLVDALQSIAEALPLRTVAVCRELTKLHEEVVRGSAAQLRDEFAARDSVKGEIVIVIDPAPEEESRELAHDASDRAAARAATLLQAGKRPKDVVRQIAAEFSLSRNDAYDLVLALRS